MPDGERPLVSILIPCFNAESSIARAIESALAQEGVSPEVIVLDDGSTDGSWDVLQGFAARIELHRWENSGAQRARNELLKHARGEWIQYLDADDELLPGKLARQIAVANANPEAGVILSRILLRDERVTPHVEELMPLPMGDYWHALCAFELPQTGGPIFRKSALDQAGGWREEIASCHEPTLYFDLLRSGVDFATCDGAPGAVYRIWSTGTVCRKDVSATQKIRASLLEEIEAFLKSEQRLEEGYRRAMATRRLEIARSTWPKDEAWAEELAQRVAFSIANFVPRGNAFPWHYRVAYAAFGFRTAERLARWKRSVFGAKP